MKRGGRKFKVRKGWGMGSHSVRVEGVGSSFSTSCGQIRRCIYVINSIYVVFQFFSRIN